MGGSKRVEEGFKGARERDTEQRESRLQKEV